MSDNRLEKDPLISKLVLDAMDIWAVEEDHSEIEESYREYRRYLFRKWVFMGICAVVAVIVTGIALTVGEYDIGFLESYQILWGHITGNIEDPLKDYIIINLRLPRIAIGMIAGVGLAVAGVVMQSTMRNPLADPYTTGVSSGALFGATLAMTAGATIASGQYSLVINAFVFSLIPTMVIVFVSKLKNASPTVMIMSGIAVMYIFNAMTTVMMLWADPNDLGAVYEWQVGTLANASWGEIPLMLAVTAVGVMLMQLFSRKLNVLSTGDECANALGVDASKLRIVNLLVVAFISAAIVSFTGLIGFVGLVAPHVVRMFIGPDNKYLIPASALFGATLLIAADLLGRTVIAPATLQVGVITAFLGGPLFLWLIIRRKSDMWG